MDLIDYFYLLTAINLVGSFVEYLFIYRNYGSKPLEFNNPIGITLVSCLATYVLCCFLPFLFSEKKSAKIWGIIGLLVSLAETIVCYLLVASTIFYIQLGKSFSWIIINFYRKKHVTQ